MDPEDCQFVTWDPRPRPGVLLEGWLREPVDLREIEECLAGRSLPDCWLEQ